MKRAVSETSLMAFQEEEAQLGRRQKRILQIFRESPIPLSCRDILDKINQQDETFHQDMNFVRPRIHELSKKRLIIPLQSKRQRDRVSGKSVMLFVYRPQVEQLDFISTLYNPL